jgi:hypothetical protein
MTNKIIVLAAAACGIGLATSASAMPLNRSDNSVDQVRQVRMVCDEYGRCWRETNPGEDIARGVLRGLEGRSMYRHRDWDHDRQWHRDHAYDDED